MAITTYDVNKLTLAYPNYAADALYTGGTYNVLLPLDNVKNRLLAKRARTVNASTVATKFQFVLGKVRSTGCFAIAAHNFSGTAKIRIRTYSDESYTTLTYDSGLIDVWPVLFSTSSLEWEDNNYWYGTLDDEDANSFTPLFVHFYDMVLTRSVLVEIEDDTNISSYVEFGRVFIGRTFQPRVNMSYGVELAYENSTTVERALDTTEYFDIKKKKRRLSFSLDGLDREEAIMTVFDMQRQLGVDRELIVAYDLNLEQPENFARTFLGRNVELSPITHPFLNRYGTAFNILEIN